MKLVLGEKQLLKKKKKKEGGYFESENYVCFSETERLICSSKESDIPHRQFSLGLKKEKKTAAMRMQVFWEI